MTGIDATTIKQWLETAKAATPWIEQNIALAAKTLEDLRLIEQHQQSEKKPRHPAERAQKAIDELRNALTILDKNAEAEWADMQQRGFIGQIMADYQQQMTDVKSMLAALIDLPIKSHNEKSRVNFARAAYDCFLLIAPKGKANRGEKNPALNFVEQALKAGGFNIGSRASLEGVLVTRRTKRDLTQKS